MSSAVPKRNERKFPLPELASGGHTQKIETPPEFRVRLIQVQDQERRRIARELHDSTGQSVAALKMNLASLAKLGELNPQQAEKLSESLALLETISTELRTVSYLLHPPLLEHVGLASALRNLVDGFSQRSGIETSLRIGGNFSLPSEIEISIYRIVQECLTNVHRHSGSPTARVRVEQFANEIEIEVQDDGKGISHQIIANGSGVGLFGMRERAAQLGCALTIKSNGHGTTVMARLPVCR